MNRSRRHAALCRAVDSARVRAYSCEPLEQRVLLDANDPVIVLTEPFDLTTWPLVNETTVLPWLWKNPLEYEWDLSDGDWNSTDEDHNGYPDDAYGWNFDKNEPSILTNSAGHGATIMDKVLRVLNAAGPDIASRVKIMFAIGTGAQITQYVVQQKQLDANIIAISTSGDFGFTREHAETLRAHDILYFPAVGDSPINHDPDPGTPTSLPFLHATPRSGIQQAAVQTIIPVTTDPSVAATDYGINSFYFAASGTDLNIDAQSYSAPVAATYAAIAAQAYQDAHNGATPTPLDIKRAMMSGLVYQSNLDGHTIAHDYVSGQRVNGGVLDLGHIINAINGTGAGITGVRMTPLTEDLNTFAFSLNADSTPTNWTVSWGDNSFANGSGVEVLPGVLPSTSHPFPLENIPHHYYPTIYAMLGTGNGRQVYLQSSQLQVNVTPAAFAPTSGQDNYTLSRSGNFIVLTLRDASNNLVATHSFAQNELPACLITLGPGAQGGDTLTVDFSNGDPLVSTLLKVKGTAGAGNIVRVIGSAGADTISNFGSTIIANDRQFTTNLAIAVYIDGAGGNDHLTSLSLQPTTVVGGAGDDVIDLPGGKQPFPETLDGGDGIDTVYGVSGPDPMDQAVEYFVKDDIPNGLRRVYRYNASNQRQFSLTQITSGNPNTIGNTTFDVKSALSSVVLDSFGTLTFGTSGETVPVVPVTSLLVNGENKAESFDIEANVNVTLNAAGGSDIIAVTAPHTTIDGDGGDDMVYTGNSGDYQVDLGPGFNYFFGGASTDYVTLDPGGIDIIHLGAGDDTVDALYDIEDNDYIYGDAGYDTLLIWAGLHRNKANLESIEEIVEV